MSTARVWFVTAPRSREAVGLMLETSGFLRGLKPRKRIGLKVHFGEAGNDNHIDPEFVRAAAVAASYYNLQPVQVETTALYRGRRQNAADHRRLAIEHGFGVNRTLAPIEILDGEQGERCYEVPLPSRLVPVARLARGLRRLMYLINLAHFKGHFVVGFGGTVKNLAMGFAAKAGKLEMHSDSKPFVDPERCVSCGECVDYCPHDAIGFYRYIARIGLSCTGCGGCLAVCPQAAIQVKWNSASSTVQLKMAEYARAVLIGRQAFHFNFAVRITPNCDCYPQTENPFTADIGVFGSSDPVACDQAAYDRVRPGLAELYPHLDPGVLLEASEKAGIGTRHYRLEEL
ncbi:MAG TPA: DUF362 domain-containing protein [candidate division WOR-3 bacterium]|uniref:DUF362 domain-containing protein n=1 Tax=candidate division WOR-3 bacterium TaxID=2052148 RepID=A0A7V0XFW5_UNCW3|nr:DUF362 domain-containing protein [candidate division WOR-3 bacterium]